MENKSVKNEIILNNDINQNQQNGLMFNYGLQRLIDAELKERKIYINSKIIDEVGLETSLLIRKLARESDAPIYLYINTQGGSVTAGLMIIDTIKQIKAPVITYCIGIAASMGALILSQGDKRYAYANSLIMIHQPLTGVDMFGKQTDIEIIANNLTRTRKQLEQLMANSSKGKTNFDHIHALCEKDTYLTAQEALDLGLIDEICEEVLDKDIQ